MSNTKFRLLESDCLVHQSTGARLYRIQCLQTGDLGGYVQSESNLSQEGKCWIQSGARVWGKARISGDAMIFGGALVCDRAQVFDQAQVFGHALVAEEASVSGNAQVFGFSRVGEKALVTERAWICGYAQVRGEAVIQGNVQVYGDAIVSGKTCLEGEEKLSQGSVFAKFIQQIPGLGTLSGLSAATPRRREVEEANQFLKY